MHWFELSYLAWNSLIPIYNPAFSKASVWVTTQLNNVVLCSGPREPRVLPSCIMPHLKVSATVDENSNTFIFVQAS